MLLDSACCAINNMRAEKHCVCRNLCGARVPRLLGRGLAIGISDSVELPAAGLEIGR